MLAERRFELNRIELSGSLGQRHDGALGLEIQEHREPARLQVEIDYRNPFVERVAKRQREVRREARHAGAAYQANQRNDRTSSDVNFFATAGFAYLEQRAGGVARIQRQEQELIGSRPQHPLH